MNHSIQIVSPRKTVEVHLPDGRVLSGPRGASAGTFLQSVEGSLPAPVVAAIVNGDLHELTYPIRMDCKISPVTMGDSDGIRIYRRSLTFLLEMAFSRLFEDAVLIIDHSIASGGYYCHVTKRKPLTQSELNRLEKELKRLVAADLPFERRELPLAEAIAYFEKENYHDKVQLLRHRRKAYVTLYSLGQHADYHHGYMVPSTGYLKWFALLPAVEGFTLRFPLREQPTELSPMEDYPKLMAAFRQYGQWLTRLGIDNVGALNDAIQSGGSREIILVAEALHEQNIAEIAHQIAHRRPQTRIILIAGPSSSGKTTFSRRLAVQLLALGMSPFALELDSYFVDREKTPRGEDGQFDFEALEALNLDMLADHLQRLIAGEMVRLPHYNFKAGKQELGETVLLRPDQLIILEGIHGLDPRLVPEAVAARAFRIYASALTQLNLDRHNRVSTTDTRLIRRIVRDSRERGYTAVQTISQWESVRGEEVHLPLPGERRRDVQLGPGLRALRPAAPGGADPASGAAWGAGVHRGQAPAGNAGMVPSGRGGSDPG
jgi:uridine kinase